MGVGGKVALGAGGSWAAQGKAGRGRGEAAQAENGWGWPESFRQCQRRRRHLVCDPSGAATAWRFLRDCWYSRLFGSEPPMLFHRDNRRGLMCFQRQRQARGARASRMCATAAVRGAEAPSDGRGVQVRGGRCGSSRGARVRAAELIHALDVQ